MLMTIGTCWNSILNKIIKTQLYFLQYLLSLAVNLCFASYSNFTNRNNKYCGII